jgi:hypothetical protein
MPYPLKGGLVLDQQLHDLLVYVMVDEDLLRLQLAC